MKTIEDIQSEIDAVSDQIREAEARTDKKSRALAKKLRAQLATLNEYRLYLEKEPSEESMKRAAQKLTSTIERINDSYAAKFGSTARLTPAEKRSFFKERGVPKLQQQLSHLTYLLSA